MNEYVESRVREALASEHVQASLAERLKVGGCWVLGSVALWEWHVWCAARHN